jgi:hypothetical protein
VRRDTAQGATARQGAASEVAGGAGGGGDIANTISASLYHHGTVVNQDANNGHVVVGSLAARDHKGVGNQYVQEGKLVVEPFTGSSHAQYTEGVGTQGANGGDLAGGSETLLVDGNRIGDVRVYAEPVQTLRQRMGTGGNNVPVVAIGIQGNVIGRQDHNRPAGKGHTEEGEPMFTLNATDIHAVAYSFDSLASNSMKSNNPHSGVREVDVSKTLDTTRPDPSCNQGGIGIVAPSLTAANDPSRSPQASEVTQQVAAVVEASMTVRRLMPIECERLMGWPDDWTVGQSDSHRYKQCGNGVASPVAEWIGQCLSEVLLPGDP